MKRWLVRAAVIGTALALLGFVVAASGVIPIKASSGHWAVTEWLLRFGMKRSVALHSLTVEVPDNLADPALVAKGAGHYEIGCRSCHGEPGLPLPRIASRMLPMPPELGPRIRESDPKKLFYVVKHGLKFTGMPAWPSPQRDDEVWAMVAFLLQYPQLDAATYRRLAGRDEAAIVPGAELALGSRAPQAVQSCVRCHGQDGRGRGNDTLPRLAGQRAEYLERALEAYVAGRRHSGMMEPVATGLTREAAGELARYYADLPAVTEKRGAAAKSVAGDETAIERGRLIATEGLRDQRVPACLECHGPSARRGKPAYPLLAGQPAKYLESQLTLFRENRRGGSDHAHLMQPIASRLKPQQAQDVARYFASLAPDAPVRDPAPRTR